MEAVLAKDSRGVLGLVLLIELGTTRAESALLELRGSASVDARLEGQRHPRQVVYGSAQIQTGVGIVLASRSRLPSRFNSPL